MTIYRTLSQTFLPFCFGAQIVAQWDAIDELCSKHKIFIDT